MEQTFNNELRRALLSIARRRRVFQTVDWLHIVNDEVMLCAVREHHNAR